MDGLMPNSRGLERPSRSRRTCLTIPGSSPKMLLNGPSLSADEVVLDLEDAVVVGEKFAARAHVVDALRNHDWGRTTRAVRVNDATTPWVLRDLDVIVSGAKEHLDVIVLPKVQAAGQVVFVDQVLAQLEAELGLSPNAIGLELQIEDAQGLVNIRDILAASSRTEAVIFGPGDMAAALGMPSLTIGGTDPDYPGDHWHAVLMTLVIQARNAGVQVVDGPYARVRDLAGFAASARRSRALGFDGKWVLHPDQIAEGNDIFSVPQAVFERAVDILDAYQDSTSRAKGPRGASMFGDEMIDVASKKMAEGNRSRGLAQGLEARPVPAAIPFHERAAWRAADAKGAGRAG